MKTYTRADFCVKRVLIALAWAYKPTGARKFGGNKSLTEVTDQYNKIFPPGILGKIVGVRLSETEIKAMLDFLVTEGLVTKKPPSFTDRYLDAPELHYQLSQTGVRYMRRKK